MRKGYVAAAGIVLGAAVTAGSLCLCGGREQAERTAVTQKQMTETKEWSRMESVDIRLEEMTAGEEYQKADLTQKREMVAEVLAELEKKGLIREVSYFEKDGFFSFKYANGILGGIAPENAWETTGKELMNK